MGTEEATNRLSKLAELQEDVSRYREGGALDKTFYRQLADLLQQPDLVRRGYWRTYIDRLFRGVDDHEQGRIMLELIKQAHQHGWPEIDTLACAEIAYACADRAGDTETKIGANSFRRLRRITTIKPL